MIAEQIREPGTGRFLPRNCTDPNCDGQTVADTDELWLGGPKRQIARCDGLTHVGDDGPLIACERTYRP